MATHPPSRSRRPRQPCEPLRPSCPRRRGSTSVRCPPHREHEQGSGSVLVLGTLAMLLTLLTALLVLAAALTTGAQARTAADLTALAAAGELVGGLPAQACGTAEEVAGLNGARLLECQTGRHADGAPRVTVLVAVDSPLSGVPAARARARAGGVAASDDRLGG